MNELYSVLQGSNLLFSIKENEKEKSNSLDVALSETYSFRSESTDLVLQDNTVVSDHIINKPLEINVVGIVSDTPIKYYSLSNSKDFYRDLLEIRNNKVLLTIATPLSVYESMILIDLLVTRSSDKAGGLFVELKFKKFNTVEINTKDIIQSKTIQSHQGSVSRTKNKGVVQTKQITNESWLSKLVG